MKIDRVVVGYLQCNCYVLSIGDECIVIDPGDDCEHIKNIIANKKVIAILITHHHFDHIGAIDNFDKNLIYDFSNLEEKEYQFSNFKFEVINTPGHTNDLLTYYFKENNMMFTGDFLFKDSIGRTDFENSSNKDMINSLNKIKRYDNNIIIYPGHGDSSTLGHEKDNISYYINYLKNE